MIEITHPIVPIDIYDDDTINTIVDAFNSGKTVDETYDMFFPQYTPRDNMDFYNRIIDVFNERISVLRKKDDSNEC